MSAPVYRAWENYQKARKPGGLNYSTFKYRYLDGKKEDAKSSNRIKGYVESDIEYNKNVAHEDSRVARS